MSGGCPQAHQQVSGDKARSLGVTRVTLVLRQHQGLGVFSSSQQKAKVRARRLSWRDGGASGDGNSQPLEQTVLCPGSSGSAEPRDLKPRIAWCNPFPRHDQDKCDLC